MSLELFKIAFKGISSPPTKWVNHFA